MIKMDVKTDLSELEAMQNDLNEEIDRLIYDIADQIFAVSQGKVPVRKGTLKKSGSVFRGRGYAYIGYNTPYAETVHDGYISHQRTVRSHTRVNKMTGAVIQVRSHTRQMNQKTGNPYLDDAITEVMKKLEPETRDLISITRMEREI